MVVNHPSPLWLDDAVWPACEAIAQHLCARGQRLVTAESCTGGLMAAACTALAGSSDWLERGVVTYSNTAKTELLDVPAELIAQHGAVSEAVVRAMTAGALHTSGADWAVAVTGVAGPGGGSIHKPVGTVWIGWQGPGYAHAERFHFDGDRAAVRAATVLHALQRLQRILQG